MGSMFKGSAAAPPPAAAPKRDPMESNEAWKARQRHYKLLGKRPNSILADNLGGDGTDDGSPPSGEGGIGSPL